MNIYELFLYERANFLLIDHSLNAAPIETVQLTRFLQLMLLSTDQFSQASECLSGFHAHFTLRDGPVSLTHPISHQTLFYSFEKVNDCRLC